MTDPLETIARESSQEQNSRVNDALAVGAFLLGALITAYYLKKNPESSKKFQSMVSDVSNSIREGTEAVHTIAAYSRKIYYTFKQ